MKPKRLPNETERSCLALLDTCVGWGNAPASLSLLRNSAALKRYRAEVGLDFPIGRATVAEHLTKLAHFIEVLNIITLDDDYQSGFIPLEVREELAKRRNDLAKAIRVVEMLAVGCGVSDSAGRVDSANSAA